MSDSQFLRALKDSARLDTLQAFLAAKEAEELLARVLARVKERRK